MIKYDNIQDVISASPMDYFSFITCNNDTYRNMPEEIKNISSFYYVLNMVNKHYIEEFTNYNYKNSYNDNDITIEKGEKATKYKFVRLCSIDKLSNNVINIISDAAIYVFIDNENNMFSEIYKYLNARSMSYIKIIYNGQYKINNRSFTSTKRLFDYIMDNYYL